MTYPLLKLKHKKEISILRKHPWVFSGALAGIPHNLSEGDHVHVADANGKILATGHFGSASIAVRLLDFGRSKIDAHFYEKKLQNALDMRLAQGIPSSQTNGFRLVHGEGDGLPGLIVDVYAMVAVMQCHSAGMNADRHLIEPALRKILGNALEHVVHMNVNDKQGLELESGIPHDTRFTENGLQFRANWAEGQKTGFFLDQRENRALLGRYAKGRKVLNAYCYTGGFSLYALRGGAREVHSLDSSNKALQLVNEHIELNQLSDLPHNNIEGDVLKYLNSKEAAEAGYDLIVLDPPAFAKHRKARHAAVQAYKRLNARAIQNAPKGCILFTFSCSQVVDKSLFNHTIIAAAMESQREVRIMHQLHQPPDHPIGIFHPEGEYLKGLVLYID